MLHRFPSGDFSVPWKGFIFGVNATDVDEGTFFISDFHQSTTGSNDKRFIIDTDGIINIPNKVDTPEIFNSLGDFKIQPDVQGDVVFFGDTQVANDENSKIVYIKRQAPEGNDYIRFYISQTRNAYIHASRPLTLQAQIDFTINSVTEDIIFKVGDNAGVKKFYFRDSDGEDVAKIDSNGVFTLDANTGAYLNLVRGTVNKINNYFDSTYTDLRFEGEKEYNRIGTWIDKSFQIVTNSLPRITIDKTGGVKISNNLAIGTDPDSIYPLNILYTDPYAKFTNDRTTYGLGYNIGGWHFYAGTATKYLVSAIEVRSPDTWTGSSHPTEMNFKTTDSDSVTSSITMRLDENGANIAGNVTVDDSRYVVEGSDSKSILRKIQLQVGNGATPGTNLDIVKYTSQGREYNAPTITNANDLAKSGTNGSYSLSSNGENLTLDISETVVSVISIGVISDDLNNGGGGGYYVHTLVIDGNIQFMVEKSGSTTNLDWTTVTNTGSDVIIFDVLFITSD
jgi:hypothetical protein